MLGRTRCWKKRQFSPISAPVPRRDRSRRSTKSRLSIRRGLSIFELASSILSDVCLASFPSEDCFILALAFGSLRGRHPQDEERKAQKSAGERLGAAQAADGFVRQPSHLCSRSMSVAGFHTCSL